MHHSPLWLSLLTALTLSASLTAQKQKSEPVTEERVQAAYRDAQAACEKVLGVKLDELPPLTLVDSDAVARAITAENLPSVRHREPDETKAIAEAERLGLQHAPMVYAKYSWSPTKSFLVVAKTWELNARVLKRPGLTGDHALRAVMVHELCHAIDDRKFDFEKRLLEAETADAITAISAVIEGHAQLVARRVCFTSGWSDGFDTFTDSIGAVPENMLDGEASKFLIRATAAANAMTYIDGERFVTEVLKARPDTGSKDLFMSPPKETETIQQPQWYLEPKTRPELLYDVEPALDGFVASFDPAVWSSTRNTVTGKQIASGLSMLPKAEVDAFVRTLRSARLVQLTPTAAPQAKAAILIAIEFDTEDAARNWIAISERVSDQKDETMDKGILRITDSKTTVLEHPPLNGIMQEKQMKNGRLEFDVTTIDAHKGRLVIETIYSGDPPKAEDHVKLVATLLDAITKRS
jgi:hypothetical protein